MDDDIDVAVLLDGITASELDAAVALEVVTWADVVRFAVDRLVDGWDTPTLRELAAEPADERRAVAARVAPRWRRLLDELGVAAADTPGTAVMRHAEHLLRIWHEGRLDLLEVLEVVSRLRDPLAPVSPVTPEVRTLDLLMDQLTFAMERPDHEDVAGYRRAAVAGLLALEAAIAARAAPPPGPHGFTPSSWCGGLFELDLEVAPEVDVRGAVEALREEAGIVGVSPDRDIAPGDRLRWDDPDWAGEYGAVAHGTAAHPDGVRVVCGYGAIRLPGTEVDGAGPVKLVLWVPTGALSQLYPLAGTFVDGSWGWRGPMVAWFTDIAVRLHRRLPFLLGRIDFELDARPSAADVRARGVPAEHHETFLVLRGGRLEIHRATS
ncbi:hypothetical protein [Actinomycetospora aeridis]|uniref:Uncharacterized protein n=1 Tax=Actinomycetospora aeridis TaxID=3129231 RepID=A0ABU8N204_9PSEU